MTLPFWLVYIAALPIYDFRKLKRVDQATLLATGFLLMIMFGGLAYAMSDGWVNLARSLLVIKGSYIQQLSVMWAKVLKVSIFTPKKLGGKQTYIYSEIPHYRYT